MASKVIWSDGMFIRPQHFQQQERFFLSEIHNRIESINRFNAGLQKLKLNVSDLKIGRISLEQCAAVFPDGTTINAPDINALPASIAVADAVRDAIVYLVLPVRNDNVSDISNDSDSNTPARYLPTKKDLLDVSAPDGKKHQVDLGEVACKLMYEEQHANETTKAIPEGYLKMPIAYIDEVVGGSISLNDDFIPMHLNIQVSTVLTKFLSELRSMMEKRADQLAARATGKVTTSGVSGVEDFLLLQTINRLSPVLEQAQKLEYLHPLKLYETLISLSGELSTYMTAEKRPSEFPLYNHERPNYCFNEVMTQINTAFTVVIKQIAQQIELSPPKQGIRAARLTNKSVLSEGYMMLAVRADVPEETLRTQFPMQVKIGPGEQIFNLVQSALRGIELLHRPQVPPEIRYMSGYLYFELSRDSDYWKALLDSAGLAIHVGGNFPGLDMQLWVVHKQN